MVQSIYIQPVPAPGGYAGREPFLGRARALEGVRVVQRPSPPGAARPSSTAAEGPLSLEAVETRYGAAVAAQAEAVVKRVAAPPTPVAGLTLDRPRIMGVLNVTPDSFSDGGLHLAAAACLERARAMVAEGVDIFDIGGESTRPGAELVPAQEECARILPAIEAIRAAGLAPPISVDTRKPEVARAAFAAGARIWNDVSSLGYAQDGLETAAALTNGPEGGWICLMHAQGDPKTMQDAPHYEDPLLDVYDRLARRLEEAVKAGAPEDRVILDPGIGFGKLLDDNLSIFRGLSLYTALGAPLLIGASRKRFIGELSGEPLPKRRGAGSVAAALWSAGQGARILRVHDVEETAQALRVWSALTSGGE